MLDSDPPTQNDVEQDASNINENIEVDEVKNDINYKSIYKIDNVVPTVNGTKSAKRFNKRAKKKKSILKPKKNPTKMSTTTKKNKKLPKIRRMYQRRRILKEINLLLKSMLVRRSMF